MLRLIFFVFITTFLACSGFESTMYSSIGNGQDEQDMMMEEEIEMEPPRTAEPPPPPPPPFSLEAGSKVIKIGSMVFDVVDLAKAKSMVDTLIARNGAYYENENYNAVGNRINYSLTVRIPIANFDATLNALERGMGKMTSKSINVNDVTEEYVDLNIRMENNLAYLAQYKEILRKATTVKDILEVQEKIRRIEEEIESRKGRLQFLDNQVQFSTLHLEISELLAADMSHRTSFGRRVSNAFQDGVQGFLEFLVGLVNIWPFLLLIAVLVFFRKNIGRALGRK